MKCWQVIVTICQHIIIMLHTILVSTRNFVTARPHNNVFALWPYLRGKSESDRPCPFVPKRSERDRKEIGKKITSELFWQGLGLQEKGILANVVKDPQQLNGPESNLYRFLSSLLPSFLSSCSHPRKHVKACRVCPGYLQVCPLFRLFTYC